MPPRTTATTTTAAAAPAKTAHEEFHEVVTYFKRVVLSVTYLITGICTCVYISSAVRHSRVIYSNPEVLKDPYGMYDLSYEKVGYSFAIGRAVYMFLALPLILSTPGWTLFLISMLGLIFEIPLGFIAESTFGYTVAYATLDLTPVSVSCDANSIPQMLWGFYTAYGKIVAKPVSDVCQEFTHEGSLLRGSLLFIWFTLWISMFIIALFGTLLTPAEERNWTTFLVCLTGIEVKPSWAGFKRFFSFKLCIPGRRSKGQNDVSSEVSTLADESVTVEVKN